MRRKGVGSSRSWPQLLQLLVEFDSNADLRRLRQGEVLLRLLDFAFTL